MTNPCFADTPETPYYVVIFSAQCTPGNNGAAPGAVGPGWNGMNGPVFAIGVA